MATPCFGDGLLSQLPRSVNRSAGRNTNSKRMKRLMGTASASMFDVCVLKSNSDRLPSFPLSRPPITFRILSCLRSFLFSFTLLIPTEPPIPSAFAAAAAAAARECKVFPIEHELPFLPFQYHFMLIDAPSADPARSDDGDNLRLRV